MKPKTPFIWPGGKANHLAKLKPFYPPSFEDYYEPFIGGGSVFLHIGARKHKCHISDLNTDLLHVWKTIQKKPRRLMHFVDEEFSHRVSKEEFFRIRDLYNAGEYKGSRKAAAFLFLNKRAFGGIMRWNKHGELCPTYSPKLQPVYEKKNILAVSKALRGVSIKKKDYRKIKPKDDDFVFLDPPYIDSASFYIHDFDENDTLDFYRHVSCLHCWWMVTNFDHPYIRELFKDFYFNFMITRNTFREGDKMHLGTNRKPEIIITNYDPKRS